MRGVLFDLDMTLLDIDLQTFLHRYVAALSETMATITDERGTVDVAMHAVDRSTEAMMRPHPGITNREAFNAEFERLTGIDLELHGPTLERFYAESFPALGDGFGPMPGARIAVETALELGMKVAIATNPIFPRSAIDHRLSWAGLADIPFDAVTSYEWMLACKPHPEYFLQTAEAIGIAPSQCLMVGDDVAFDLPAADVGMRTFYVGDAPHARADHRGDLETLTDLLLGADG